MLKSVFCLLVFSPAAGVGAPLPARTVAIDKIDRNHSTIGFSVPILGGLSEVEGKFTEFAISILYDTLDVTHSSVTAAIAARSINTGISERDDHLRSGDFFDVERFPEIRFTSDQIEGSDTQVVVRGELSLHGVKRPISLPMTFHVEHVNDSTIQFAASANVNLDRDDWGISWRHPNSLFVSDTVRVRLRLISRLIPLSAPR
jgi:polyisoprenoid-binding protein YceI